MGTHASLMKHLAAQHEALLPLLAGRELHYLDLPFYDNVGDLLIMLGTLRFFEKHALPVSKRAMYFNFSPSQAHPDAVIVMQGGGNFGDIYGPFQRFRERIIDALPHQRIVILPQSLHFNDPARLEACCSLMRRHPDLHICVRDHHSAELAQRMTPHVYLMPDMAHQLWPLQRSEAPSRSVLQVQRRDSEVSEAGMSARGQVLDTMDWADLVGSRWRFFLSQIAERSLYHAHRFGIGQLLGNLPADLWVGQAQRFVDKACEHFSRYERVKSDRLHAHILSCLLSIPNVISDNSYGKNSRYINTWTAASDLVTLLPGEAAVYPEGLMHATPA